MNQNNNMNANLKVFIVIGLTGFIIRLINITISVTGRLDIINLYSFHQIPVYEELILLGSIISIIGLIGIVSQAKKLKRITTIFLVLLIPFIFFRYQGFESSSIEFRYFYLLLPFLAYILVYSAFYKQYIYAKLGLILLIVRFPFELTHLTIQRIIRPEILKLEPGMEGEINEILFSIRNIDQVLTLIEFTVLVLWFFYFLNHHIEPDTDKINKSITIEKSEIAIKHSAGISGSRSSEITSLTDFKPLSIPIFGKVYGIPKVKFWCESCNKQKNVKFNINSSKDYEKDHFCPKCNNTLLIFYEKPEQSIYNKFVVALILTASGLFTFLIEGQLKQGLGSDVGFIIFILVMIQLIPGIYLVVSIQQAKVKEPPNYATTRISKISNSLFYKELVILVTIALVGGGILWQLNLIVIALSM